MLTKIQTNDVKEIDLLSLRNNILKIMYCLDQLNLKSEDLENCIDVINWLLQKPDCKCESKQDIVFSSDTEKKINDVNSQELLESFNYIKKVLENYGRSLKPEMKLAYYARIDKGLNWLTSAVKMVNEKEEEETASLSEVAENLYNALENIFGSL